MGIIFIQNIYSKSLTINNTRIEFFPYHLSTSYHKQCNKKKFVLWHLSFKSETKINFKNEIIVLLFFYPTIDLQLLIT